MELSREAKLMSGVTLLTVPTIVFGGLTVLSVVTQGAHGSPFAPPLTEAQQVLYRAGHAHAGVLLIFSLVLQVLLDSAALSSSTKWVARVAGPSAAILLSGGFFGIAHLPALGALLWLGAAALVTATVVAGVGLVKKSAV